MFVNHFFHFFQSFFFFFTEANFEAFGSIFRFSGDASIYYTLFSEFVKQFFQIFQICSAFFVPLSSLFPDDKILLYTVFDRSQHFFHFFTKQKQTRSLLDFQALRVCFYFRIERNVILSYFCFFCFALICFSFFSTPIWYSLANSVLLLPQSVVVLLQLRVCSVFLSMARSSRFVQNLAANFLFAKVVWEKAIVFILRFCPQFFPKAKSIFVHCRYDRFASD